MPSIGRKEFDTKEVRFQNRDRDNLISFLSNALESMHHIKVINSSRGDKLANDKKIRVIGNGVPLKGWGENPTLFFIVKV
ncbi:hypothetical protein V6N13_126160 [Hibiscus sabdariffa]